MVSWLSPLGARTMLMALSSGGRTMLASQKDVDAKISVNM